MLHKILIERGLRDIGWLTYLCKGILIETNSKKNTQWLQFKMYENNHTKMATTQDVHCNFRAKGLLKYLTKVMA